MQLDTQQIRDRALALAVPIGKAAVTARKSALSGAAVAGRTARSGFDQAMEASRNLKLQAQLERLLGRPQRDNRKTLIIAGAVLAVAGVGAALLASAPVRRAVKGQVDRIRGRMRGRSSAPGGADQDREDDLLDQRIDASFPASDPVGANHVN
jgi:hypothetical protein